MIIYNANAILILIFMIKNNKHSLATHGNIKANMNSNDSVIYSNITTH